MKGIIVSIVTASLIFALMVYCAVQDSRQKREQSIELYNAWVKYTGNPRHLTLEEFLILKSQAKAKRSNDDLTVIIDDTVISF